MEQIIKFGLSNPGVVLLVLGVLAALIQLASTRRPIFKAQIVNAFFSWFLFFSIGLGYFFNFIIHAFYGGMAAKFIGWADSPFQLEVGFASLGFSALGFLAFRGSSDLRLAAIVGSSLFLLGAAGGHIYQIINAQNYSPGNAGLVFYLDIILPILGFSLLWLQHKNPLMAHH